MDKSKTALQEERPAMFNMKDLILLHDNARLHAKLGPRQNVAELNQEILSHPSYTPDLEQPSDYQLFFSLQKFLQGKKSQN